MNNEAVGGIHPMTKEQWYLAFPDQRPKGEEIPQTYFSPTCYATTSKTIGKYLEQQGFVQENGRHIGMYRNGFVRINPDTLTISHTVSPLETRMEGDVNDWITYFKRL